MNAAAARVLAVVAVVAFGCRSGEGTQGEATSGTSRAESSTAAVPCDAATAGTCLDKLHAALGLAPDPAPLCGEGLQAWSELELCLFDCDALFPPPDDEGFCGCLLDACAGSLVACDPDAAMVCDAAGTTGDTGTDTTGGSQTGADESSTGADTSDTDGRITR